MKKNSFSKGITIVEIVVAAGIIAVSVVGIIGAIQVYLKVVYQNTREAQAVLLLDETAEAVQYLRDRGFDEYIGMHQDMNLVQEPLHCHTR